MRRLLLALAISAPLSACLSGLSAQAVPPGYYRMPTVRGQTIVFVAEGDLWSIGLNGGAATRLTSHPSRETNPALSPDGKTLAFTARYEGPAEVYTMAMSGGTPVRRTWDGDNATVIGWTAAGKILYSSAHHSTLPDTRLFLLDPKNGTTSAIALNQAADGSYDASGKILYFTRQAFQGSHTRRYQGGTAEQIWKYADGAAEAAPLTASWAGTSKAPMVWQGRVYFASDRDGTMNLWSMDDKGGDLKQLTRNKDWDLQSPQIGDGHIVYQLGADLHRFDIESGKDVQLQISLPSDFDQLREYWVQHPFDYLTSAHISADGERLALTARGQIFVAPAGQGRLVEANRKPGVRYRDARFMPDGKSLIALGTETGEVELTRLPANGVGDPETLTHDGKVLRWEAIPSPDGKQIAHRDKNETLWLYEVASKKNTRIATSTNGGIGDLHWSPDSRWLAFNDTQNNGFGQLVLYDTRSGTRVPLTSDRYDSYSTSWSADGKWIYFISDRHFDTDVGSPWGARAPEPHFDRQSQIYAVALQRGLRFPFRAADELQGNDSTEKKADKAVRADSSKVRIQPTNHRTDEPTGLNIAVDTDGVASRLYLVPVPAGNIGNLTIAGDRLFYTLQENGAEPHLNLKSVAIGPKTDGPETFMEDIRGYELSGNGKKVMVRKGNNYYVMDVGAHAGDLAKSAVDLGKWSFSVLPREEWRQMFNEAWRLERDYFYDPNMHGNNWPGILAKYQPLAERVTDREELSDLLGQMVSELSALHIFVYGGDRRRAPDAVEPASLGAELNRDEAAGGYRIGHIFEADADEPESAGPLARADGVAEGDLIEAIDGTSILSLPDYQSLLRNKAGQQVLLRVHPKSGAAHDIIVTPISQGDAFELRYSEWELTRRQRVEKDGAGKLGYVHLRAMGQNDIDQWARDYYPVFDRAGLIIDVRHNRGGNIDSWILEKLMRKVWMYWQARTGKPYWNMQYGFRGHVVVLCDEWTASDGELFAEGFRRLGIGKVIGTRTWGGEIWLTSSNVLVDRGIATAAEFGIYGPEGSWLIEGHGVDPDITVDNQPHATFGGEDAQLAAAIKELQAEIAKDPVTVPGAPRYPDKVHN